MAPSLEVLCSIVKKCFAYGFSINMSSVFFRMMSSGDDAGSSMCGCVLIRRSVLNWDFEFCLRRNSEVRIDGEAPPVLLLESFRSYLSLELSLHSSCSFLTSWVRFFEKEDTCTF